MPVMVPIGTGTKMFCNSYFSEDVGEDIFVDYLVSVSQLLGDFRSRNRVLPLERFLLNELDQLIGSKLSYCIGRKYIDLFLWTKNVYVPTIWHDIVRMCDIIRSEER